MTLPLLRILGHQISNSGWKSDSKQVFWAAAVITFFGSFHFGEILCPKETSFNSNECLLWEEILFLEDSVTIHVKILKSRNLKGEFIHLYKIQNKSYCPVSALSKLKKDQNPSPKSPVFQFCSGSLLPPGILNSTLRELLLPVIGSSATTSPVTPSELPSQQLRPTDLIWPVMKISRTGVGGLVPASRFTHG